MQDERRCSWYKVYRALSGLLRPSAYESADETQKLIATLFVSQPSLIQTYHNAMESLFSPSLTYYTHFLLMFVCYRTPLKKEIYLSPKAYTYSAELFLPVQE